MPNELPATPNHNEINKELTMGAHPIPYHPVAHFRYIGELILD